MKNPEITQAAARFESLTGMKTLRKRAGVGSMRGYFETLVKFDGTQNELRILLTQLLGFQPFFVQSEYALNNTGKRFDVNVEISKLA
jgi:adenylosuccinate lyase